MLKTKAIKAPIEDNDGLRISVMSRHTLNDGITLDPEITQNLFDDWWPQLGPSLRLIGSYYKRGLPWEDFEKEYLESLRQDKQLFLQRLISLSENRNVTILCIEVNPDKCHRRLIAEECARLSRQIKIQIS